MKKCNKCKKVKEIDDFYYNKLGKQKRNPSCKKCDLKRDKEWKHKNRRKIKEQRVRHKEKHGEYYLEKKRIRSKRYYENNKEKTRCRARTRYAVKTGKIVQLACQICGNFLSESHHHDYTKHLDVWWLCKKHHILADMGKITEKDIYNKI